MSEDRNVSKLVENNGSSQYDALLGRYDRISHKKRSQIKPIATIDDQLILNIVTPVLHLKSGQKINMIKS